MYRKLIVPLEGSELAEAVLLHMETIAGGWPDPVLFLCNGFDGEGSGLFSG